MNVPPKAERLPPLKPVKGKVMLRKEEVTSRVQIVSLPDEQSNFVTLVQKAVRPDGKERTITQKVPVRDSGLCVRLINEVPAGAEIEATIVTEWHKNGYTAYLSNFRVVPSPIHEQIPALMAKIS